MYPHSNRLVTQKCEFNFDVCLRSLPMLIAVNILVFSHLTTYNLKLKRNSTSFSYIEVIEFIHLLLYIYAGIGLLYF